MSSNSRNSVAYTLEGDRKMRYWHLQGHPEPPEDPTHCEACGSPISPDEEWECLCKEDEEN